MDLLLWIVIPGLLALLFLAAAWSCGTKKRYPLVLIFGALELLSMAVSASAWSYALKISGKVDWFLLGLWGYTPIALFCYAIFIAGIVFVARGIWKCLRQKNKADFAS